MRYRGSLLEGVKDLQDPRVVRRVLLILGTRPEVIKLAPVYSELLWSGFEVEVCSTGQHEDLFAQAQEAFQIHVDYDLKLMRENQDLFYLTEKGLPALKAVLEACKPDLVIVQGDTTSALLGALAGFYAGLDVAHVEAGLRTFDPRDPFPEEMNRKLIDHLSTVHFAPTMRASENLEQEGIPGAHVVGNTVVDALSALKAELGSVPPSGLESLSSRQFLLVTAHRRESFGEPLRNICRGIKKIVEEERSLIAAVIVHPNPNVKATMLSELAHKERVLLLEPLQYRDMLWLIANAKLMLTDSGGLQEEAPCLHKPVLILRKKTERPELLEVGGGRLVGRDPDRIAQETLTLLHDQGAYDEMARAPNPFGDGRAAKRIVKILSFMPA
ncbi:MAG: UDP-N-acetylglucosamine 2-epimerase (non-hydrolyzing) [Candidatus Methanosuratincola petrocarbonis]